MQDVGALSRPADHSRARTAGAADGAMRALGAHQRPLPVDPFELLNTDDAPSSPCQYLDGVADRAEFMGALAAIIFIANFMIAMFAVVMALVAAAGHQADDRFCEGVMGVLGAFLPSLFLLTSCHSLGCAFGDSLPTQRAPTRCSVASSATT